MFVHPSESVASVLSENRLFEFSSSSIYQASIVYTPFTLNQRISRLAAGISLLAYKHRVYGVLLTFVLHNNKQKYWFR